MSKKALYEKTRKLRQFLNRDLLDSKQVEVTCELLSNCNLDCELDGLPLVRMYLTNCFVPNAKILGQMAACGYFDVQDKLDVPLRLAIDLHTALNRFVPMIPCDDILNDDSCWDGPFLDYVLKKSNQWDADKFLEAAIECGARVTENTLPLAMICKAIEPKHVELLLLKGCQVSFEVVEEAVSRERFDLLETILKNFDDETLKVRHPNILVRIADQKDYRVSAKVPMDLIPLLVGKFGIDIDYVVKRSLTALDCALYRQNHKASEILIKNFADTNQIAPFDFDQRNGFALSFKLLAVLGHEFDFEELKVIAERSVKKELEEVENWIDDRSKKVLTLKELSALQVRRHATKEEIDQLIEEVEIPKDIQDILFLKCYE